MTTSRHTHAMTLRLDPTIDELLTEAAFDRRTSKAQWIRFAIRHRLGLERGNDLVPANLKPMA